MLRKYTKGQIVGFVTLVIIGLIVILIGNRIFSYVNEPKEELQNVSFKDDGFYLKIKGNFVTYTEINEEYKELGAEAYVDNTNVSNDIVVSYYQNGSQVSYIDTRKASTYLVSYVVEYKNKVKEVTRVVIVTDSKAPNLSVPDTVTITSFDVANFNVEEGVSVTDNGGEASFECENTLSMNPGNYVITCMARDKKGNKSVRKRLVKVIDGIEFQYDNKLIIKYPTGKKYTYKYSLDSGKTWIDASNTEILNVKSGNVIALVLEDGKYKMSNTYYIK